MAAATALLGAVGTCTACGTAAMSRTPPSSTVSSAAGKDTVAVAATAPTAVPASSAVSAHGRCAGSTDAALARVAARIATRAQDGPNALAAARRVAGSRALAAAVARDDGAAAAAALPPLLRGQIQRVMVFHGTQPLAAAGGTTPAMAPVRVPLYDHKGTAVGTAVLSVASDAGIGGTIHGVTGASVVMARGHHVVQRSGSASSGAMTATLAATAFPSGHLRMTLALPGGCAPSRAVASIDAVAAVAHRLLADEVYGSAAQGVLQHVATDPGFRAAVAHRDPAALRAAIVRFFQDPSLHVVRIRATTPSGQLIGDVGGPYVLSPISGPVTSPSGRVLGRVTLSIQDDAGYVKLLHGFTGADVVLRTPSGTEVPSSTLPGAPSSLPASGVATVHGRRYLVRSLTGTAFPSGPLRITALVPLMGPAGAPAVP